MVSESLLKPGKKGDLVVLGLGALYPLAFSPFSLFPLAYIALAGLFLFSLHLAPKQAFWRGWLFGLSSFGIGVSWVFVSIHNFGGVGVFVGILITLLFVVFLSLFPALLAYAALSIKGAPAIRQKVLMLLLFPAAWLFAELLRSWF